MQARSLVVVAVAWAAVAGCAQVWGIGDVPVPVDATTGDALAEAAGKADADAAPPDTTGADTTAPDTTSADAPTIDSTLADTSTPETSVPDTSTGDTSVLDTSLPDTSVADAPAEAAFDAGCPTDPCLMASGLNHPAQVVSDDVSVYWIEFGTAFGSKDGTVKSCPVAGCGAGPTLLASALLNPRGIVVDSTNVYFATATFTSNVPGAIWSCPLAGCNGSPTMLAPAGIPDGIAVDSTYVYWVDSDENTVNRVLKNGTSAVALNDAASPGPGFNSPQYCVVDGVNVYVSDANQSVVRLPIAGGAPPTVIAHGTGGDSPLAIDPSNIYYVANGKICSAAKTSTDGGPVIAGGFAHLLGLTLDGDAGQLYWADYGSGMANDGTVGKVGIDGGMFMLASMLATPESVTVSGAHLFWVSNGTGVNGNQTDPNTGTLTRLAK